MKAMLRVTAAGDTDRLLRRCAREGVTVFSVEAKEEGELEFSCRAGDVYRIKHICFQSACRLGILKKRGAAFIFAKILKRPVLPFGLIAAAFALWIMCGFVWSISVEGCVKTSEKEIRELLSEAGLRTGAFAKSIRASEIKNRVISENGGVAYLTVNVKGSRAYVTVYERTPKPEMTSDVPCDVVSGLTGVVSRLRVRRGEARIAVGQTVKAGDLIASGKITDKTGETRYLNASAEADVRTWYKRNALLPSEGYVYRETGRTSKRFSLIVFGKRVDLYLIESPGYKWYYKNEEIKVIKLGDFSELPIAFAKETFYECGRESVRVSEEDASELLERFMLNDLERSLPEAEIIKTEFYTIANGEAYEGVLRSECIETTGIQTEMKDHGTNDKR